MSGGAPLTLDHTRVKISFPLPLYKYPMNYADIPDRFSSTPRLSVSNLFLSLISLRICEACPPIGGVHVYTRMPSTSIIPVSQTIFFCSVSHHSYWYSRPFLFYSQSFSKQSIPQPLKWQCDYVLLPVRHRRLEKLRESQIFSSPPSLRTC